MTEDAFLYLGDSWIVVVALGILMLVAVVVERKLDSRVVEGDTQSHRDTILFEQIEEFRRDFS